jgi:hypothetical protein
VSWAKRAGAAPASSRLEQSQDGRPAPQLLGGGGELVRVEKTGKPLPQDAREALRALGGR